MATYTQKRQNELNKQLFELNSFMAQIKDELETEREISTRKNEVNEFMAEVIRIRELDRQLAKVDEFIASIR